MLTIIHGENIVKSRLELEKIKKQNQEKEIILVDGRKINLTVLKEALESGSMFKADRLVIIEDLFSIRSKIELEKIINYIVSKQYSSELILWEKESLTKTLLTKLKADQALEFKPEQMVFKFLDSLKPGNVQESLILLAKLLKTDEPEIVIFMIIKRFRLLLLIKDKITSGTDDLNKLASWQISNLTKQANYFTLESLVQIYHQLLEIDAAQKTGQASFNLKKTLELFITNI